MRMGRREFAATGLSAAAWLALETAGKAKDPKPAGDGAHHDSQYDRAFQDCAKACSDCQRICDACATHCTHMLAEGNTDHLATQATCLDCADLCAAASKITARGGVFAELICQSCSEACARCAAACEKLPDDRHMAECAKECRRCEEACRKMLDEIGHGEHQTAREAPKGKSRK